MSGPAYRIETPRLVLRCYTPEDAPLLDAAIAESLAHLWKTMNFAREEPMSAEQRIALLRRFRADFDSDRDRVYGVFSNDETRIVGGTGLHRRVGLNALEIGYWVHVSETRKGYATELAAALTRVAVEVEGVRRVEIHCDPENRFSARVAEKLGYRHEATLKERLPPLDAGCWRDMMIWTLFASELAQSPAARVAVLAYDAAGCRVLGG